MDRKQRISWADVSESQSSSQSIEKHFNSSLTQSRSYPTPFQLPLKPVSKDNQLSLSIKQISTDNIHLCLLGVAFQASYNDIRDYFQDIRAPIVKFIPQKNKRVYVIIVRKQHALVIARINKHTLKDRDFMVKVDRERHNENGNGKRYGKYREVDNSFEMKSKSESTVAQSECKMEKEVGEESELMVAFRNATISEENLQIIRCIKAKGELGIGIKL